MGLVFELHFLDGDIKQNISDKKDNYTKNEIFYKGFLQLI